VAGRAAQTVALAVAALLLAGSPIARGAASKVDLSAAGPVTDPCNQYLAIQVDTTGRFNEGAFPDPMTCGVSASSFNLSYAWPGAPGTSFDTIRVDGSDYIYGSTGSVISPPTDINSSTNQSSWQVTPAIEASQTLSIVTGPSTGHPDTALIATDITNTDSVSHQVGLRAMIDTMLNNNDGAPFFIPGAGGVTTETEFTGAAVPQFWQAFYSLTSSSQYSSQGTLVGGGATTPDRFVVAAWPRIFGTAFDYSITPGLSVTADSAVAVYWMPRTLAPGATLHLATMYGLSGFSQDLSPPLALSVTAPASLTASSGGYTPNPFTVSAFTQNVGAATATGASLTLNLPSGLTFAPGQNATQQIGDLAPGASGQASWQVLASPQPIPTTLTYSVTAAATNAASKVVNRSISLPPTLTNGQLCGSPQLRNAPSGGPQPVNVVIFMDGIGSEENQSGTFYPIPISGPKARTPVVTNYCPLDAQGHERGWPVGLNLNLRRFSEFSLSGGGSSGSPTVGQVCDLPGAVPGGFYTDSCMVARLADRGAVMLPYSYAGAQLKPDGRFDFHAYTAAATKQPPDISIALLENEIRSIRRTWGSANVYVVAHSYAGSVASHWWETYHRSEPEVRKVFTLDGTVNGNANAGLASFIDGPFVTQLWNDDWNNLFANGNSATRDATIIAHDGDQSLVTVGTPDDPTPGLPIEAQVLVHNCSSAPFYFHCDPVVPPSVISDCSAKVAIYGVGGSNDGHDVVKVCPDVVRRVVAALR
jgi:hypothetical protein